MKFEVSDRGQGLSGWLYDNGELLAWPDRYFASLAFARREAAWFKASTAGTPFENLPVPGGWRWRAVQPVDYYMAYSPKVFARPAQALTALIASAASSPKPVFQPDKITVNRRCNRPGTTQALIQWHHDTAGLTREGEHRLIREKVCVAYGECAAGRSGHGTGDLPGRTCRPCLIPPVYPVARPGAGIPAGCSIWARTS